MSALFNVPLNEIVKKTIILTYLLRKFFFKKDGEKTQVRSLCLIGKNNGNSTGVIKSSFNHRITADKSNTDIYVFMYFQHLDPPSTLFVKYLINTTFRACLKYPCLFLMLC